MVKGFFKYLILFYVKFLSKLKPPTCRFYPSCSQYALDVLEKYNLLKALYLILIRILKCNPFHPGGYDPA